MEEREFNEMFGKKKLLFKPKEVADMFSISLSQVYDLVDDGVLKVTRDVNGKKIKPIRILRKSVLAYLKQPEVP